jgi:hypothetical protein
MSQVYTSDKHFLHYCKFANTIPSVTFTVVAPLVSDPANTNTLGSNFVRLNITTTSNFYMAAGIVLTFSNTAIENKKTILIASSLLIETKQPLNVALINGDNYNCSEIDLSRINTATNYQVAEQDTQLKTTKINDSGNQNYIRIRSKCDLTLTSLLRQSDLNTQQFLNSDLNSFYYFDLRDKNNESIFQLTGKMTLTSIQAAIKDILKVNITLRSYMGYLKNR